MDENERENSQAVITYRTLAVAKGPRTVAVIFSSESVAEAVDDALETGGVCTGTGEHLDIVPRTAGTGDCEHSHEGDKELRHHHVWQVDRSEW